FYPDGPRWRPFRSLNPTGRHLEFGDLADRVDGPMRQEVSTFLMRPVVRNEHRIWPNSFDHQGRQGDLGSPGRYGDPVSVLNTVLFCQTWMELGPGMWILLDERTDSTGLAG